MDEEEKMVENDCHVVLIHDSTFAFRRNSPIWWSMGVIGISVFLLSSCSQLSREGNSPTFTMTFTYSRTSRVNLTKFYCNGKTVAAYLVHDDGTHESFTVFQLGHGYDITIGIDDWNGDGKLDTITFSQGSYLLEMFVSPDGISWSPAPREDIDRLRKGVERANRVFQEAIDKAIGRNK